MKNFEPWNQLKEKIESRNDHLPIFHEREVWWCSLGTNIGHEQDGKNNLFERPVLILKKFDKHLAWILPMTSQKKKGDWFYAYFHQGKMFFILLLQLRLISSKRLHRFIYKIAAEEFNLIQEKIIQLIITKRSLISEAPQ